MELFSNHQKSPFTSDLMSNAAGTCSRTWDRIGPKVTSLHTSISPEFSKNQFGLILGIMEITVLVYFQSTKSMYQYCINSYFKSKLFGLVYNKHIDNFVKGYLSCLREPTVFLCGHVVGQRSKIYKDWVVTRHSVLLPVCICLVHCRYFQDNEAMG